jgi:hypothetical protein
VARLNNRRCPAPEGAHPAACAARREAIALGDASSIARGRRPALAQSRATSGRSILDRHKPPVDVDPSARDVGTMDMQAPHRQAALGPADLRRHPDRHRLVGHFEDAEAPVSGTGDPLRYSQLGPVGSSWDDRPTGDRFTTLRLIMTCVQSGSPVGKLGGSGVKEIEEAEGVTTFGTTGHTRLRVSTPSDLSGQVPGFSLVSTQFPNWRGSDDVSCLL